MSTAAIAAPPRARGTAGSCCFARHAVSSSPRPRAAPCRAVASYAMASRRPVRAALFDMDGTILDIEPLSTLAINQHVEPLGGHVDSRIKRLILGKRAAEWTRIVIEECGLQGRTTPAALEEAWERNLMALYPTAEVLPGVERLTAHLAACGVPMAVATSSSAAALAAKRMPHEGLFSRFAAFVTAEDVARGKPAPDAFLRAAEALRVPPAECIVFEDAQSGVEAGLAAGCAVVAVPDAKLHADVAPFAEAHAVLRSLEDFDPAAWGLPPYPAK